MLSHGVYLQTVFSKKLPWALHLFQALPKMQTRKLTNQSLGFSWVDLWQLIILW